MKHLIFLVAPLLFAASATTSIADEAPTYLNGQRYIAESQAVRLGYVQGAWDGWASSRDENFVWMNLCAKGWTSGQLEAVLTKWFKDHPQRWNNIAASEMVFAIGSGCPHAPQVFRDNK